MGIRAPYDVIIVADDNAFRFALDQQEKLFNEQPIVFLGVNNVDLAIQQNANPKITGVVEAVSMEETVELMLKLRPETTNVVALVDDTPSGQGDLQTFYHVTKKIKSHTFSDISLSDMTWEEFFNQLSGLDEKNVVLLLSAYRDKNSSTLLFNKSLAGIKEKLSAPLFHLWYHGIGDGILGGRVINHYEQGKAAAEIVLQILDGKTAKGIKVVEKSPNQYVFDYNQLKKYNLPESILPENNLILNKPHYFYDDHKTAIWFAVCVVSILTIALFIATINIVLRKRVEIKLRFSEIKHKEMIANISDVIAILDPQGIIMYQSPNIKKFYGWDQSEFIGKDSLTTAHPDDVERIRKELKQLVESKLGAGTVFTILFPMANETKKTETEITESLPHGTETILFVDDEESIVKMAKQMLMRLGYNIQVEINPIEALASFKLKPNRFDLVITDMTMPQMTGVQLSEKLLEIRDDIPVIICTGYSSQINEEKAKKLGLAGFIMKPIVKQEIAKTIRRVLDS